jgi:DMSO reductase family type II enzyme chaperone
MTPPTETTAPPAVTASARLDVWHSRTLLYSVLAQSLSVPTHSFCDAVCCGEMALLIEHAVAQLPASHTRGLDMGFLKQLSCTAEVRSFEDVLGMEYTRLFALNVHCPQYEADYLGRSSFHWSEVISSVSNMYSAFGVQLGEGVAERPDHIAIELDFMNLLTAREVRARELNNAQRTRIYRKAEKMFFASHLARWGAGFARRLKEETRLDFYRGIGLLLETFLRTEGRCLKVELTDPDALMHESGDPSKLGAPSACGCTETATIQSKLVQVNPITAESRRPESLQGKE